MRSRPDGVFCRMAGLTHDLPGVNGLFAPVPSASQDGRRRKIVVLALAVFSLIVMWLDHRFIYQPLEIMMLEPEGRLDPEFFKYHQWSKYVNCVSVGACLIASFVAAIPLPPSGILSDSALNESAADDRG